MLKTCRLGPSEPTIGANDIMIQIVSILVLILWGITFGHAAPRITESFDLNWRFLKSEAPGAEMVGLDDTTWRRLDLPHDCSIEGPFAETNPATWWGGYLPTGVAWYRKNFLLPTDYTNRRVFVDFDGVMANSDVWINGHHLGHRPNGYVSFRYELTPWLNFGARQTNIISVRVDTSEQPSSRWYAGSGIYRHVWLVVTDPVHVEHWGTIVTTPEVSAERASVRVQTLVTNQSLQDCAVRLQTTLIAPDGKKTLGAVLKQLISAGNSLKFDQTIAVENPKLWDTEHPWLYRAVTEVWVADKKADDAETTFGIRKTRFDAETGFWLNDRNLKLKGVCLHHDAGALGTAVPLRAWERRLELLKSIGCNALRTSHNPVAPEFLDLADRMGFLVMDEFSDAWRRSKVAYDYGRFFQQWWRQDLGDTIRRDRNHPSIVIYSAGNEIHDVLYDPPLGIEVVKPMCRLIHELDPTRPVTVAVNQPQISRIHDSGFAEILDVAGYNYAEDFALNGRKTKPERKIIGTENGKSPAAWRAVRDHADLPGMFCWTGFDYFGEAIRRWPSTGFEAGMFDRTGAPHAAALQFQTYWQDKPVAYVVRMEAQPPLPSGKHVPREGMADWNPPVSPGEKVDLEIYANCPTVELWLNDKSLGTRDIPTDASPLNWTVPYEPGVLRVVGIKNHKSVCSNEIRTATRPVKIILEADHRVFSTDREDVCYVTAKIVDANGTVVPSATNIFSFQVLGPATILAVDNGSMESHDLFQTNSCSTYKGRCVAIVQPSGKPGAIRFRASAGGFAPIQIKLDVRNLPVH